MPLRRTGCWCSSWRSSPYGIRGWQIINASSYPDKGRTATVLREDFSKVTVYWEGTNEKTGEGNGVFTPAEQGEDAPAWIVYISAEK